MTLLGVVLSFSSDVDRTGDIAGRVCRYAFYVRSRGSSQSLPDPFQLAIFARKYVITIMVVGMYRFVIADWMMAVQTPKADIHLAPVAEVQKAHQIRSIPTTLYSDSDPCISLYTDLPIDSIAYTETVRLPKCTCKQLPSL